MEILVQLLDLYCWIIIASALISWFPLPRNHPLVLALNTMTEPFYAPIRRVLDPNSTGGLDLAPLILLFGVQFLQRFLLTLAE